MIRPTAIASLLVVLSGCPDDSTTDAGSDTSVDAPGDAGDIVVAPPAAPALPVLFPCAPGFRLFDADGVEACDPWPETGRQTCAEGEAHFPGTPACAPVGPECPADGLPASVPSGPVIYVSAGAVGGTGASDRPLGTIAEATAAAAAGDAIAIGVGDYPERVVVDASVILIGACASGVRIEGLDIAGEGAAARNLTLGGGAGSGISVPSGTSVDLEAIIVDRPTGAGIDVRGGSVLGRDLVVSEVIGVDTADGCGLGVYDGGSAEVDGLVIDRARADAVYVTGTGSTATLSGASIFDVQANGSGEGGRGLAVFSSGTATMSRSVVEGARSIGVLVRNRSTVTLTDVVVRGTLARESDGQFGRAASTLDAATLTATRFFAEGNRDVGIFSEGDGTEVTLEDVIVRDMRSEATDGSTGKAVQAQNGGRVVIDRGLFVRARDAALVSHGELARIEATDITVRETLDQETAPRGAWGAATQSGAAMILRRAHIDGSSEIGLYANGRMTTLLAEDVLVTNTESHSVDGTQGRGINVQLTARATLTRVQVEGSREAGVLAIGTLTRIVAEDLTIRNTQEESCSADGCETNAFNLGSYDEAEIVARRFAFEGSDVCGVWLDEGGALDLREGIVSGSTIGACIIDGSFDIERIGQDVEYTDNETNLDAPSLPVPATIEEIPI